MKVLLGEMAASREKQEKEAEEARKRQERTDRQRQAEIAKADKKTAARMERAYIKDEAEQRVLNCHHKLNLLWARKRGNLGCNNCFANCPRFYFQCINCETRRCAECKRLTLLGKMV